jgi:hypothetical protein
MKKPPPSESDVWKENNGRLPSRSSEPGLRDGMGLARTVMPVTALTGAGMLNLRRVGRISYAAACRRGGGASR